MRGPPTRDTLEEDTLEAQLWRSMVEYLVEHGETMHDALELAETALRQWLENGAYVPLPPSRDEEPLS